MCSLRSFPATTIPARGDRLPEYRSVKVLHAYNQHRGRGGADYAAEATVRVLREHGLDVHVFMRDSRDLPDGLRGRVAAFTGGLYARSAVRAFEADLDRIQPDLVHVHELYPMISPWILPRCQARGVPVVMSCSDYRLSCPITTHFRDGAVCTRCMEGGVRWALLSNCRGSLLESTSYALFAGVRRAFGLFEKHVARFVMPSDFALRWTCEALGLAPERFVTIYPSVSRPEHPADPGQGSYVAYAGRFAEPKGLPVLLRAVERSGLPLRLAGDADHLEGVEPSESIRFIMTKGPEELAAFYRGARVLVVPSIWNETFGMVAAEAMSHGIPVVASRMGALTETVGDGIGGVLVEAGDDVELASALERLWNDAPLSRALGLAGRERVHERCSPEAHLSRLVAVYEDVLGNG